MKKIFRALLCLTLFVLCANFIFAQEVYLFDCGKSKGKLPTFTENSVMYVDANVMAKKLGGAGVFFSKSKQLKITIKNFTAVFTEGSRSVIKNGQEEKLPLPAIARNGKIYVPIDFFLDRDLSSIFNKQTLYSDGKFCLEEHYNVEYVSNPGNTTYSALNFEAASSVEFTAEKTKRTVVEITLKNAVIKRQGTTRIKDKFITNFNAKKCGNDVCISILMTSKAKDWKFERQGTHLVFIAKDTQEPINIPDLETAKTDFPAASFPPSSSSDDDDEDEDGVEVLAASSFFSGAAAAATAPKTTTANGAKPKAATAPSSVVSKGKIKDMRIVIDPGHGGKDPGAVRKLSSTEKYINLEVAKEVTARLKKRGFNVKMTRTGDTFVALNQRSKIANDFDADLFVSIHANASKKTAAQGFEVYFRSEKATDAEAAEVAALENEALQYEETNLSFADMLLRSLAVNEYINESSKAAGHVRNSVKSTSGTGIRVTPNNSIRQANFYVLKGVDSPAILIEMGYISNASDRKQLNNKNVRAKMADGIYKGILSYARAEGWQ
ncbi:N-acetylmuramoyl-L-alanine amidase [Elusimicrobium posterum]|uniref:N-acetylmuramoyl-L-alanine amidase n=1 Tax=Elusimicrobium posterum TaxID=3116653 RepID=UPI003C7332B0